MNIKKFQAWAEKEHSPQKRLLLIIPALMFFCFILPVLFVVASAALDQYFHWPLFGLGYLNGISGIVCILIGAWLGLWTVRIQFVLGGGTPAPFMPTHNLIILGPYKFCRNPMVFGVFIAYLGIAVWAASPSGVIIAILFLTVASGYIKLVEENELEVRFGAEYTNYKKITPFILPYPKRRA